MDNENEQLLDGIEGEEEQTVPEEVETQEPEMVSLPKDKFKSMQRKAIAFDAQKNKTLQAKDDSLSEDVVKTVRKLEMLEEKRKFGYENQLSPEETDWVFNATGGRPTKESLESPFIKHGIDGYRASKKLEANTPSPSSRSSIFQGKEFKDMDVNERKKAFEEAAARFKR